MKERECESERKGDSRKDREGEKRREEETKKKKGRICDILKRVYFTVFWALGEATLQMSGVPRTLLITYFVPYKV